MRIRGRGRGRRGAAAVEMAAVFPVFLAMTLGLIEASRLGMASQLLTTAAREGARVASLPSCTSNTPVQDEINAVLGGSGITPTVAISCADGSSLTATTPSGGTSITVTLSVPYKQIAWFTPIQYYGNVTLTSSATMVSERP